MTNERLKHYDEIADLLRRWNVAEGKIGQFDRGLHILGFLAQGFNLEDYGEPRDPVK